MGAQFGTPDLPRQRTITQTFPNPKQRLSFTPVKVKDNLHFVEKPIVDEDDDSNCGDIDEDGPFSKKNYEFLKTKFITPSNLKKQVNMSKQFLLEQYGKLQRKMATNSIIPQQQKQVLQKSNITPLQFIIDTKTEETKFKSIKILGETFNEIKEQSFQPYYELEQKVGEGSFGNVYKAKCKETGEERAIKIFKQRAMNEKQKISFLKQIEGLKKFDHINIIKLYDLFFHKKCYYVVTQFCKGGNLLRALKKNHISSQFQIAVILRQILSALIYLHDQKIAHRDLKLENIVLLDIFEAKKKNIKMIDFGFATSAPNYIGNKGKVQGTLSYMPPQTFNGQFSCLSDMWSCGIILMLLLIGKNPFKSKSGNAETILNIKEHNINWSGSQWSKVSSQAKDLVKKMLQKKPQMRITAKKALQSQFIQDSLLADSGFQNKKLHQKTVIHRFRSFDKGSNFIALLKSYICSKRIHQAQRQELAVLFQKIDTDGSGFIQKNELIDLYKLVTGQQNETQVDKMLENVDSNLSGKVDFSEFLMLMTHQNILSRQGSLNSAFDYLDKDKTGFIEKSQLINLLQGFENQQITLIMNRMDENNDDKISRQQFSSYLSYNA